MDELQQPMDKSQQQKEIEFFKNSFKEDEPWQPQGKSEVLVRKYEHVLDRKTFWISILINQVIVFVVDYIENLTQSVLNGYFGATALFAILYIALLVWNVWLQAGRLHDIGKSAHTIWWRVVPIVGDIYLIYLFCKPTPAIYQYNKQEDSSYSENRSNQSTNLTNTSAHTSISKGETYKVEESSFRKARDRVDILKTVTILLATVLVFLAIICPFCLKSIETRLDKTPSYQIVERNAIRTEYADSKVGFIVALSIFFLLTVVSLCFLIKSIKDFRNIKRNPQAFLRSQTKQQVENVLLQKNTVAAPHDATSLQRILETNVETSAPSHIKESELLAAYRAHPELQAGIDALLGIQNNKQK